MRTSLKAVVRPLVATPWSRALLARAGRTTLGFSVLNRLCGTRCVYRSFERAWDACRRAEKRGYEDNQPLHAQQLELPIRPSDYPALAHLVAIGEARLFEFGSSMGNLYYLYRPLLGGVTNLAWTGYDLPGVVEEGRALARERGETNLRFASDLSEGRDSDVVLFSGSLHYWERSMKEFFDRLGSLPRHVIVNRSPMRERGEDVVAIQREPGWYAFPCLIRSREKLIAEFARLGYELEDAWKEPGLAYNFPLLPEYSVPAYSGLYFRLPACASPERDRPVRPSEEALAFVQPGSAK